MIGSLSRRERLVLGLGLLTGALVLGWELGVQPMLERRRALEELVPAREELLAGRQAMVGRRAALEAELAATEARIGGLGERFLPGATPAVAASELQKTIKDLAARAGTEVRSERILPPVERGALLEIPIEVTVSGEIRHLVDLLASLESTSRLLRVQELRIRVTNVNRPGSLLATVTLSGVILRGSHT